MARRRRKLRWSFCVIKLKLSICFLSFLLCMLNGVFGGKTKKEFFASFKSPSTMSRAKSEWLENFDDEFSDNIFWLVTDVNDVKIFEEAERNWLTLLMSKTVWNFAAFPRLNFIKHFQYFDAKFLINWLKKLCTAPSLQLTLNLIIRVFPLLVERTKNPAKRQNRKFNLYIVSYASRVNNLITSR